MHKCAYTWRVGYEWDPAKAPVNFEKHGVQFADAATALEDDLALTMREPLSGDEGRWITLVRVAAGRLLWVLYNCRAPRGPAISLRTATSREMHQSSARPGT